MGFVHHAEAPPPAADIAAMHPRLGDRAVAETLELAAAYGSLRSALLALSGISLLRSLGVGGPDSLAGVVVSARQSLDCAQDKLGRPSASAVEGIRRRAAAVQMGVAVLDSQVRELRINPCADVDNRALHAVQRILADMAVPDAGLRHFNSVSCAAYPGAAAHDHGHHEYSDTPAGHVHVHRDGFGRPPAVPALG